MRMAQSTSSVTYWFKYINTTVQTGAAVCLQELITTLNKKVDTSKVTSYSLGTISWLVNKLPNNLQRPVIELHKVNQLDVFTCHNCTHTVFLAGDYQCCRCAHFWSYLQKQVVSIIHLKCWIVYHLSESVSFSQQTLWLIQCYHGWKKQWPKLQKDQPTL